MSEENGAQNGGEKRKVEDEGDNLRKREKLEGGTLLFAGATDWKVISNNYCKVKPYYLACVQKYTRSDFLLVIKTFYIPNIPITGIFPVF